jgi:hypothetical protein
MKLELMKFHEISWNFDGMCFFYFQEKSFMKFFMKFHEIFHEKFHDFAERFSPGKAWLQKTDTRDR